MALGEVARPEVVTGNAVGNARQWPRTRGCGATPPTDTRRDSRLCTAPAQWHPDDCEWYDGWEKGRPTFFKRGSL